MQVIVSGHYRYYLLRFAVNAAIVITLDGRMESNHRHGRHFKPTSSNQLRYDHHLNNPNNELLDPSFFLLNEYILDVIYQDLLSV